MYLNRTGKFSLALFFFILLVLSVGVTYLISTRGALVGPLTMAVLSGLLLLVAILRDYRVGFYFVFALGIFMFYIDRLVTLPVPLGVVYDATVGLTFAALFLHGRSRQDWTLFKNPIKIAFVIITCYQLLQLFNPNAVSPLGWMVSMRNNVSFLIYAVCFQLFAGVKDVKAFTFVWIGLTALTALYGIYQELFDLTDFEWRWMNEEPARLKLFLIWGKLRKFSFLSDPSSFGLFMAFGCIASLVLAMGPFKAWLRILFVCLALLMFISMSYSGTRTAIAMVAIGVAFFIVMTLRSRKTILATAGLVMIGAAVFFGPFYGGTINRIRSTFNPSDDKSMAVRDMKRVRLQEYVLSHPIGGGLYTAGLFGMKYSPGHPLAGKWDPDSGYLLTALEMGWVGLIIFQVFFFMVMLKGISNYFAMSDPLLKTFMLTYIVPFLALSVAHFTQDAMFQKPVNIVVIVTYVLVIKMPSFEKKLFSVDLV